MNKMIIGIAAFLLAVSATLACGAEPVKIGMITTLSTKAGYLGEDIRDGFKLAIAMEDGKLGGVPVELLVDDDSRKPEKGRQIAERFIKKDHVRILTGIVFSNVAMAVVPKVVKQGIFYISPNAGPSRLAGKGCDPRYFNVAWQNDNLSEVVGQYVKNKGFSNVYLLAPNYPAGKDALAGFKRFYQGKVAGEVYTTLGQSDYAAELATLRAAKPDAVFFFLPGGMGINFLKQYAQAGLKETIPVFGPAFSFDERILKAVGDAAVGVINGSQWSVDLDVPANNVFVAAFIKAYGRTPTLYASQGYDDARLIGSALKAVNGDMTREDAFQAALAKADFASVRGAFSFGPNHHPIQDIYVREVVKDEQGNVTNRILSKVFTNHQDAYAPACRMQ
ncbi:MAG: ABC transporter substrate-binding protein [Desulfobulbus sp.]|nr:MAG: ABC transporter substrate-binding protein [Desulfobulbus sp.]RUM39047.1 MAG: ABC transporter substrate-binding protein [Desulfobulbus sp.]RUM40730.1 MAG: ABC transporter substrate-binding protein [Desulfobulbus sp.]